MSALVFAGMFSSIGVANAEFSTAAGVDHASAPSGKMGITRTLKLGDRGNDVRLLQELLATYPEIFKIAPTGYFGPLTALAVKKLQVKMGLEQVGGVGPRTLKNLNAILAKNTNSSTISEGLLASEFALGTLPVTTTLTESGNPATSVMTTATAKDTTTVTTALAPLPLSTSLGGSSLSVPAASDPQVAAMGTAFVNAIPTDWYTKAGSWKYFDAVSCFTNGQSCFGNNPSSPYGFPSFTDGSSSATSMESYNIRPNDAIVIFLRTPPQVRYYGFTQYLVNRGTSSDIIFASMSDTLNLRKMQTSGSPTPGVNVFDKYAVVVWTADMNSLTTVKNILHAQGIPDSEINFIPLPIQLPLNLGNLLTSDNFTMLMRTALPTDQQAYNAYLQEKPFYVVKVGPKNTVTNSPAPTIGYASEVSGITESSTTQAALDSLVSDIKKNYVKTFALAPQTINYGQKTGWDCIANPKLYSCNGDNHDALYSADVTGVINFKNPNDIVIVAGVNHQLTGQAVYINHSVYDVQKIAGIVAVADPVFLERTALYHAGVKLPGDPRVQQYKNLYAYIFAYDCTGLNYCQQIPPPTPENPVGLPPGTPFLLVGRSYLNPNTNVRPSVDEIVHHQVLIGTHR